MSDDDREDLIAILEHSELTPELLADAIIAAGWRLSAEPAIRRSRLRAPFPEGDPRCGFEWLDDERLEVFFGDKVREWQASIGRTAECGMSKRYEFLEAVCAEWR